MDQQKENKKAMVDDAFIWGDGVIVPHNYIKIKPKVGSSMASKNTALASSDKIKQLSINYVHQKLNGTLPTDPK